MRVGEILAMERAQVTQNRQFYLPLMGGLALLAWIGTIATTYNAELGGLFDFIQSLVGIYIALIVARTVLLGQDKAQSGAPVFPYFGNALLIMLLLSLVFLPFMVTAAGLFHYAFGATDAIWEGTHQAMTDDWWAALPYDNADSGLLVVAAGVGVLAMVVISYVGARFFFCMPGVALGRKPYGFVEGWRDSAAVALSIVFACWTVILAVSVVLGTLGFLLSFIHDWLGLVAFSLIEGVLGVAIPVVFAVTWQRHIGGSD